MTKGRNLAANSNGLLRPLLRFTCCGLLAVVLPVPCCAQNVNLKIGDAAPHWKDLPGVDGKPYALADFKEREILVIAFTCNSCPYAADYEDRLVVFAKTFGEGAKVALVAINANKVAEDQPEKMRERAKEKAFNFPYLWDETQTVARSHGAIYTPEFFVFDKERRLAYHGAFDDNSQADQVKQHYLSDAVNSLLAGQPLKVTETQAIGCAVRYERKKREKQQDRNQ